jgi:hypothetical protein
VNDYKTTDTFNMEIDYKNFPFDPRSIRSCGVVIYFQDMGKLYNSDGTFNKIIPGASTVVDPTISNAVFIGFADEEEIEFDDTNRMVKLSGRDTTALLIDQKYINNTPISLNLPIDEAIQTLLSQIPAVSQVAVLNQTIDPVTFQPETLPTLAQYYPDFNDPLTGSKNPGQHETYWEIIQDICHRAGLICYFSRSIKNGQLVPTIILANPKNQFIPLNSETKDDIKIIYGVNVKNLKLKRKLGRFKGFNLQVRCRIDKQVLIARIPEQATVAWGTAFGFQQESGTTANGESTNFAPISIPVLKPDGSIDTSAVKAPAPYITFPVHDVADLDALVKIGQTLYEQYSLQQLEGSFDTFEMLGRGTTRDTNGDQTISYKNYDLTQIRKGQTICLEINTDDLGEISRLSSYPARVEYLIQRNYDSKVASVFAETMGKFSPRFQIKSYRMSINDTSGWKLSVDFQNIIDTTFRSLS